MAVNIVHAFLKGVGKRLDHFRVGLNIALFSTESGVGNVAGIFTQGSHYIAVALGFQRGGVGFEFDCIRFLLLQFFKKIKTTYLMGFFVYLYILYCTLPEGLFMGFIQFKV